MKTNIKTLEKAVAIKKVNAKATEMFKDAEEALNGRSLREIVADSYNQEIPVYEIDNDHVYSIQVIDACDAVMQSMMAKHGDAIRKIIRDAVAYAFDNGYVRIITREETEG